MSRNLFGKLTGGIGPHLWQSNALALNTYKAYSSAMGCLIQRYGTTKQVSRSMGNNKKEVYKYYSDKLREDIGPLKLMRSLPALNHYVSLLDMTKFTIKYILSYRFFFIYMARTTFQAVRPLMAFCVFGELMKLILATMTSGVFAFFFSFVLAFEVLYFFLQCYISYTFLTMFFDVMF
ncbi:hypothetical protein AK88_02501 [Plasmodium fragile]|uniref:Uncharacterized protein n=1 Tax=Plasmodium fragile TaxID=5857 RepID=A0A0D9QM77_PLAFR|nr:uncharacterized protein AK88_02501 [Plasmodium fragile]KJP87897.1 hypothetical protein AK88_02501 [Plasmodium fragile]